MAINERLIDTEVAAANGGNGAASAEQNLIVHLDATDVDSYDGDGSVWYDISEHDLTIPLSDNADNLQFHLNFSDTDSYSGTGTTFNDISGNSVSITTSNVAASDFDIDNGGYFNVQADDEVWSVSHSNDLHPTTTNGFTYEFWLYFDTAGNDTFQYFVKGTNTNYDAYFFFHEAGSNGWYFRFGGLSEFKHTGDFLQNQWVHVMFTLSSNVNPTQKLYINGELKKTVSATGTITSTSSRDLDFGAVVGNLNDLYGRFGCVRLYNKELSASEVGQNYRHGRDYIYTDLYDSDPSTLELHLDPTSYSGSGTTWTADVGSNATVVASTYDEELGDFFDTTASQTITATMPSEIISATSFTAEAWVNFDDVNTNYKQIVGNYGGNEPTRKFQMSVGSDNGSIFLAAYKNNDYGLGIETAGGLVTTGRWYHIVGVVDSTVTNGCKIYIDGELVKQGTAPNDSNTTGGDHPLQIAEFDGRIGQVRLYSSALDADEVMQNYLFTKNNYPNTNHATAVNSPTFSSSYFDFDDTNNTSTDYFTLSNDVLQVLSGKEGMSISVWVNFDAVSSNQNIFSNYIGSGTSLIGLLTVDQKLRFYLAGSSDFQGSVSSANVVSSGVWTHIVAVFDGSQTHASGTGGRYQAYINGSETTMNTLYTSENITTVPSFPSNSTLRIAAGYGSGSIGQDSFDGKISKIKIYDRAITSAEVTTLYNEGSGN